MICDTGVLVAAFNADDADHELCTRLLLTYPGQLIIPATILAEVTYLLDTRANPETEAKFLDSIVAGEYEVEQITTADIARMAELVRRYATFRLGSADASVVAVAERLGTPLVATINHSDFRTIAPKHCATLSLQPPEHLLARNRGRGRNR